MVSSRNGPHIGGHLRVFFFFFKLNFEHVRYVLKIGVIKFFVCHETSINSRYCLQRQIMERSTRFTRGK